MVFGKKKTVMATDMGAGSVLRDSISIEGNIKMTGPLYIGCHVEGAITSKGDSSSLVVGADGKITGDVQASKIEIYGGIVGNIDCSSIKIHAKSHIKGDITYQVIQMEPSALIEGELHNKVHQQASSASAEKTLNLDATRNKPGRLR